ncbi:epimerase [Shewanella sp. NFH-SH190041]|uniref:TIGR01777 family oxidoreductase n=1 Tax=Shewanella sp. NFH-SH190041 TaxID=2950245 RepID=UPI0021C3A69B|nr:TIGR01777 family oxidoreductase [Shewanella sp. NFH-SH190041]BDM64738.1 epimerase [Shewanella sp. NFH-SH190041]
MHILITGGTGFIGRQLVSALLPAHRITILTRNPNRYSSTDKNPSYLGSLAELTELNQYDAVINLAGEPIIGHRWSEQQKQQLCHSRWDITEQLSNLIQRSSQPPKVFISASAIGYYGCHDDKPLDEQGAVKPDFCHNLCQRWESLALATTNTRVCIVRTGIVLGPSGGALAKMLLPFKLGLGGPIGNGKQGMSWIHQQDMVALLLFLLHTDSANGVYNATAPTPVSNREFSQALGHALHRPAILPTPTLMLQLMLGESALLLTHGQYVVPARALAAGFQFQFPTLDAALADLC